MSRKRLLCSWKTRALGRMPTRCSASWKGKCRRRGGRVGPGGGQRWCGGRVRVWVSPELREAVILRDLQDMDYKHIAGVLGVPEGTVKSRISRGRAELARILGRKGIEAVS